MVKPSNSASYLNRISRRIRHSSSPSASEISSDIDTLIKAINGDKSAISSLISKYPSGIPELAKIDKAFHMAGFESPEMHYIGKGRWVGSFEGVKIALHSSNGVVEKFLVSNKPVKNWDEAIEAIKFHKSAPKTASNESVANGFSLSEFKCMNPDFKHTDVPCAGCVKNTPDDGMSVCDTCGFEYIFCPGCDNPYPMYWNEDDHCPICGYSSWGLNGDSIASKMTNFIENMINKGTGKDSIDFDGFIVNIIVKNVNGEILISMDSPNSKEKIMDVPWDGGFDLPFLDEIDAYTYLKEHGKVTPPGPC